MHETHNADVGESPGKWFRVTFEEARQSPHCREPKFPEYCVRCCQTATVFSRETYWLHGPKDGMNPIAVKITVPWCRKHKALEIRGAIALALSIAMAVLATDAATKALGGNAFLGITVGIIAFFALGGILFWILGIRRHTGFFLRDNSDLGYIAFSFDNPHYQEMFAQANEWQPEPSPYPGGTQGAG